MYPSATTLEKIDAAYLYESTVSDSTAGSRSVSARRTAAAAAV
jgi:hypothetical protein